MLVILILQSPNLSADWIYLKFAPAVPDGPIARAEQEVS